MRQFKKWRALHVALNAQILWVLSLVAAPASARAADAWTEPHPGIRHLHRETATQQIHVLLVDLRRPELRVRATKSEDRGLTTSGFAASYGCAVAINGDFWQWDGYTTSGLAVGGGMPWPGENDTVGEGFVAVGIDNVALVSEPAELFAAPEAWMSEVVGGRPLVVKDGVALDPSDCDPHFCALHPRTAVGLSEDGATLVLAAIDGRTSIADGMTTRQVGELMVEMGADIALNFDGGGSTAMFVAGEGGIVNDPSDGSERVVANHLGVAIVEPIGSLSGEVHEAAGGRRGAAIAGATVRLATGESTVTDAEGVFELVGVPAGEQVVRASHPAWSTSEVSLWIAAQESTVTRLALGPAPLVPEGGTQDDGAPADDGTSTGADASDEGGLDPTLASPRGAAEGGCGCAAGSSGPARSLWLLLALGLGARRRRPRRAPC